MIFLANFFGCAKNGFVCLQITVDGEVVTDPDMTLGYFFPSQQAYYCYILPNLQLHSIVSFGYVFIF